MSDEIIDGVVVEQEAPVESAKEVVPEAPVESEEVSA